MPGPNREKRQEPRRTMHWCFYCDRARVGDGQKCPKCHNVTGTRRFKKPLKEKE